MPALSRTTEITHAGAHPGRDALFNRVDRFAFVDARHGHMLVRSLALHGVTLATVRSTGHDIALQEQGQATLLLPRKGHIGVEAAGIDLRAPSGGALFLRPGFRTTRVRADGDGEFLAAVLLVPEHARRAAAPDAQVGRAFATVADNAATAALAGFVHYLLAELDKPVTPLSHAPALDSAAALIRDLFAGLYQPDHADLPSPPGITARRVAMAEEFMRDRAGEPLTVEDIAHAVGVGPRALQSGFQALRGASPRAVLTAFRLDWARERLLRDPPGVSVTDIALAAGFTHIGRFAQSYRARFGETPSDTRQRGRP